MSLIRCRLEAKEDGLDYSCVWGCSRVDAASSFAGSDGAGDDEVGLVMTQERAQESDLMAQGDL